jgi:hypothetical protein
MARRVRVGPAIVLVACLFVGLAGSATSAQYAAPSIPPSGSSAVAPGPSALAGAIEAGDPRSNGQGPGLVGEPLLVLVGIVLIAIATVVVTIVVAKATGRA